LVSNSPHRPHKTEQTRNRNCRMLVLSLAYQPLVTAVIFSICLSITAVLFGQ